MQDDQANFVDTVTTLARRFRTLLDQELAPEDLTYARARILFHLKNGRSANQRGLSAALGLEPPSVVRLVDDLERLSLITRQEDPTDRRAKLLVLTTVGEASAQRADLIARRLSTRLLDALSTGEVELVSSLLSRLSTRAATVNGEALPNT